MSLTQRPASTAARVVQTWPVRRPPAPFEKWYYPRIPWIALAVASVVVVLFILRMPGIAIVLAFGAGLRLAIAYGYYRRHRADFDH